MNRRRNWKPKPSVSLPESSSTIDDSNNGVLGAFRIYAKEMEEKQDRYERIVKLSRDITIESKRIISTLHSIRTASAAMSDELVATILLPIRERIARLMRTNFAAISHELDGRDPYQFVRAYNAGLQEFVEALTMLQYVSGESISDWHQLEDVLSATMATERPPVASELPLDADPESVTPDDSDSNAETLTAADQRSALPFCLVDPMEFMLGVCDLSGEVMRMCINAVADRHFETCTRGCAFLRTLYMGLVSFIHSIIRWSINVS